MSQPRTQHTDAASWTPFDSAPDGQPSATHADPSTNPTADVADDRSTDGQSDTRPGDGRADVRQVAVHGTDGTHRRWQIIEGGQDGDADGFDAAADEALAAAADTTAPAVEDTAAPAAPVVETVGQAAPSAVKTLADAPVETPAETRSEPDSTLRTPHSDPEDPESENAAHAGTEEAETPHSTPAWRAFAVSLNPGGVLYKKQASLAEVVTYARTAPYSTNKAVRAMETGWNHAVAVPVSLALYSAAAAYKRLWRGLGTSAIGVLWIVTVHASPLDTSTVWTWTVLGYWALSAFAVPAIVTKK